MQYITNDPCVATEHSPDWDVLKLYRILKTIKNKEQCKISNGMKKFWQNEIMFNINLPIYFHFSVLEILKCIHNLNFDQY